MGAIAGALIPVGINLVGSLIGGSSASSAANDQIDAANQGISEVRQDMMPWLTAGQSALGGLGALLGLNGTSAQQSAITGLQSGPLFQSLYRQGTNAILGNASATGGLRGGNTEGALYNLGSDTLAQVIQQQIANLGNLSGEGLGAGSNIATSIAGLLGQIGAAKAGNAISNGQAWSSGLGAIGSLFGSGGALSGIFGGGGGAMPDLSSWDGDLVDLASAVNGF